MKAQKPAASPADVVLTFLESVARRADAEFYLRLFRQLPKESFAIILAEPRLLDHTGGSVIEQLAFLRELGLVAPVVIGLLEPEAALDAAHEFAERDPEARPSVHRHTAADLVEQLRNQLRNEQLPIVAVEDPLGTTPLERFAWLAEVISQLATRKIVILRRQGGLGPRTGSNLLLAPNHFLATHEGGISIINLTTDYVPLLASGLLDNADDRQLLECLRVLLGCAGCERVVASIASPLSLQSELFTVKGAGTLVKQGTQIVRHDGYTTLDRERLASVIASSFKRRLRSEFFSRMPQAVYVEEAYRGAAIVESTQQGPFLTKFAVDRAAQGEGIGRDLWQALTRDLSRLYWRGRPNNPIAPWYASLCDGMTRTDEWIVYWRGTLPAQIPALVEEAQSRNDDFLAEVEAGQ